VVLIAIAALLPTVAGAVIVVLCLIGQAVSAGLLPAILSGLSGNEMRSGMGRISVVVAVGSLLFALLAILYYISTLITLPFSYTLLPPVAAFFMFLAALVPVIRQTEDVPQWRIIALPVILLILPLLLLLTRPPMSTATSEAESFRFVDYNIHQAINVDGWVDPEAIALVIEAQQPQLIALQEVSRGWLIAGSLDTAEWLSRRLQTPYVYAPGHDYQFGNIILSRYPISDWSFARLPLLGVPLGRGLIRAEIDLGAGRSMTLMNTHLSAYAATESRIPQVEGVLESWNQAPRSVIVGDMNARPGEADIELYLQAGLTSAQDAAGDPGLMTYSSKNPVERIDWVFGTSDVAFSDFEIPSTTASDHLPLAVTVIIR
jgi:endonuclease/exonuclease/phosphatase family metal-dependent hydrolase